MTTNSGMGIEFQVDEERDIPFMPANRRPRRNSDGPDDFNHPREFNNPNI